MHAGSWGTPAGMLINPMLNLAKFAAWMINNQTDILPDVEINLYLFTTQHTCNYNKL